MYTLENTKKGCFLDMPLSYKTNLLQPCIAFLFWMIIRQPFSSEWSTTSLSFYNLYRVRFGVWIRTWESIIISGPGLRTSHCSLVSYLCSLIAVSQIIIVIVRQIVRIVRVSDRFVINVFSYFWLEWITRLLDLISLLQSISKLGGVILSICPSLSYFTVYDINFFEENIIAFYSLLCFYFF